MSLLDLTERASRRECCADPVLPPEVWESADCPLEPSTRQVCACCRLARRTINPGSLDLVSAPSLSSSLYFQMPAPGWVERSQHPAAR